MQIINKTPHKIRLLDGAGEIIKEFPPDKEPIRVEIERKKLTSLDYDGIGVPIVYRFFEGINILPRQEEGIYYIVSQMAADAIISLVPFGEKPNMLVPDEVILNEQGEPIGCKCFALQ